MTSQVGSLMCCKFVTQYHGYFEFDSVVCIKHIMQLRTVVLYCVYWYCHMWTYTYIAVVPSVGLFRTTL